MAEEIETVLVQDTETGWWIWKAVVLSDDQLEKRRREYPKNLVYYTEWLHRQEDEVAESSRMGEKAAAANMRQKLHRDRVKVMGADKAGPAPIALEDMPIGGKNKNGESTGLAATIRAVFRKRSGDREKENTKESSHSSVGNGGSKWDPRRTVSEQQLLQEGKLKTDDVHDPLGEVQSFDQAMLIYL